MSILAPEELLEKLYSLLREKNIIEALDLFEKNAAPNHLLTFCNAVSFYNCVKRTDSYIVIIKSGIFLPVVDVYVIGLDDNYKFFCHNVPPVPYSEVVSISVDDDVKRIMGFTRHIWEVRDIRPGEIIRLQGDVVVEVIHVFDDELKIYYFLTVDIVRNLFQVLLPDELRGLIIDDVMGFMDDMTRFVFMGKFRMINKYINASLASLVLYLALYSKLHSIFTMDSPILGNIMNYLALNLDREPYDILKRMLSNQRELVEMRDYVDFMFLVSIIQRLIRDTISKIPEFEKKITYTIGNHRIMLMGLDIGDPFEIIGNNIFVPQSLLDRSITLLLRPQNIVALHDEHKMSSIYMPPSLIRIRTLQVGRAQVTREMPIFQEQVDRLKISVAIRSDPMLRYLVAKRRMKLRSEK